MSFFSYYFIGDKVKILVILIMLLPIYTKAFTTSATSAIVMDIDTNKVIYANNVNNKRAVASISKIMTAIIALESGKENDTVTVTDVVNEAYGSGIYIKPGEEIRLIDLVYGLMLRSGNDAAKMIASYVVENEDEFVKLMNQKAKEIGMKNTTFNNASGLDDDGGNISTAYDMAILTSYAMKNQLYATITGTKKYTLKTNMNTYVWLNKNKLLKQYKYTTGGKTGFTDIARRTLVTTAEKDNLHLVVVTLNDGNDFLDHKNLYEEAFDKYKSYEIVKKGPFEIYNENYYNESYYINETFNYPLTNNEKENIIIKVELLQKNSYQDNDIIGNLVIKLKDKTLKEMPVFIKLQKQKSFFQKLKERINNLW